MRFLFKSNDASTLREAKFRESLESTIEGSIEVNEVRGVGKDMQKYLTAPPKSVKSIPRCGNIFSKNARINILRDSTVFKIL